MRLCLPILACLMTAAACGGKKDNSAELKKAADDLGKSKDELTRTKNALDACTKQFAEYKAMNPGEAQEIVVRVDGDGLTVVGRIKKAGEPSVGSGDLTEAEKSVVPLVIAQIQQSRNQIQQCYVQALKTTSGLENRSIQLTVQVKVQPSGAISGAAFAPEVSAQFTTCMTKVAERWKIKPYEGRSFPLQYPIKLTPVN
jgi:hypothetical protein